MQALIDRAWENRQNINAQTDGDVREAVNDVLQKLDAGELRIAEKNDSGLWVVNEWLKRAVLLSFRLNPNQRILGGAGGAVWWDKVMPKTANWTEADFEAAGFRSVPGAIQRHGSFVARDAVLMPSFINIGAYIDEGTMVDTWATIGACAQIGAHCHISGGAGIGGVLEPLQAAPVIIEDNVFVGARSEVAEGVIVREGSVLAMGVFLGASTKIVDRQSGEVMYGEVPPYSVVVPGAVVGQNGGPSLAAAIIVKTVDERTRSKTGINELLRS